VKSNVNLTQTVHELTCDTLK